MANEQPNPLASGACAPEPFSVTVPPAQSRKLPGLTAPSPEGCDPSPREGGGTILSLDRCEACFKFKHGCYGNSTGQPCSLFRLDPWYAILTCPRCGQRDLFARERKGPAVCLCGQVIQDTTPAPAELPTPEDAAMRALEEVQERREARAQEDAARPAPVSPPEQRPSTNNEEDCSNCFLYRMTSHLTGNCYINGFNKPPRPTDNRNICDRWKYNRATEKAPELSDKEILDRVRAAISIYWNFPDDKLTIKARELKSALHLLFPGAV